MKLPRNSTYKPRLRTALLQCILMMKKKPRLSDEAKAEYLAAQAEVLAAQLQALAQPKKEN